MKAQVFVGVEGPLECNWYPREATGTTGSGDNSRAFGDFGSTISGGGHLDFLKLYGKSKSKPFCLVSTKVSLPVNPNTKQHCFKSWSLLMVQ